MGLTPSCDYEGFPDQAGKVVVVTGANSGLGLMTAERLAAHGARVVLACRSKARAQEAMDTIRAKVDGAKVEFLELDLADLDSIKRFAKQLPEAVPHVDVLINNAGVMACPLMRTKQGFEMQMGVNHFGHFALTLQLLPLLRKAPGGEARVVTVSSMGAYGQRVVGCMNWGDLNWEKSYQKTIAYVQSKLANLLFARALQRRLDDAHVEGSAKVVSVVAHPGCTRTELFRHSNFIESLPSLVAMTPLQGVQPQLVAATAPWVRPLDYIGPQWMFYGAPGKTTYPADALNDEYAEKLWKVSEEKTGVVFA